MTVLFIERSTARATAAILKGGSVEACRALPGGGEWTAPVRALAAEYAIDAVAAGTGPGSFAGVRGAIAFAQGWRAGRLAKGEACAAYGLPSPWGCAAEGEKTIVAGDARRGKTWFALFDGFRLLREVFQTDATPEACREAAKPLFAAGARVVSPDHSRIGSLLAAAFGAQYAGEEFPDASRLALAAAVNPAILTAEPLPIYLNPAVRTD